MKRPKLSETAAAISLASAFRVPRSDSVTEILSQARWKLGFEPSNCRVILDKVYVIPAFALAKRSEQKAIRFFAEEMEIGTPMIFFDAAIPGADGAFVVREFVDTDDAGSFCRNISASQRECALMMAGFESRVFVAVKLTSIVA